MNLPGRTSWVAALLALAAAGLAFVEPVETARSDAALTLVAAQALVEHGTLSLDPYRGDPRCTYDLEHDYRVRRHGGSLYYFAPGAQVLGVPFVVVARGFGLDMLRPGDEAAAQNAASALLIGLDLWLLFLVLRRLIAPPAALAIAAVTVFGSPLVSTLATSLWGAGFAVPLLLAALRLVVGHASGARARLPLAAALVLVAGAFLCRPAAGLFVPALLLYALLSRGRPSRRALALAVAAAALAVAAWPLLSPYVPAYYNPLKLRPQTPLPAGLYGVLLSPSRGLLVFCPFLLPVGLAWIVALRGARPAPGAPLPHERALAACAWTWLLTHVLLTSLKGNWWGGYSYGPRLLAEVLPATAVLAALAWRRVAALPSGRALAVAYGVLGALAVGLHSGQGLFNPATRAWNRAPDPGAEGRLVLWWRYPQFLATEAALRERDRVWQERRLEPLRPGDSVGAISRQAVFVGWHPYEIAWRPSAAQSAIRFRPAGFDAQADYVLELRGRVPGARGVTLRLDGRDAGHALFTPPEPHTRRFVLPGAWLQGLGECELNLDVAGAARAAARDPRVLGLDFHGLRFARLPRFNGRLRFDDDPFFAQGFADAEGGGRWTRDGSAEILLPLAAEFAPGGVPCRLELEAGANGAQPVAAALDGLPLARWAFSGVGAQRVTAEVAPARLQAGRLHRLTLELPQAHALPSDPRRIGLYLAALSLTCP